MTSSWLAGRSIGSCSRSMMRERQVGSRRIQKTILSCIWERFAFSETKPALRWSFDRSLAVCNIHNPANNMPMQDPAAAAIGLI